jgi:hypothetical protein
MRVPRHGRLCLIARLVVTMALLFSTVAHALDERIAFMQAADGSIIATFSRIIQSCRDI